jgi:hypothetical protein
MPGPPGSPSERPRVLRHWPVSSASYRYAGLSQSKSLTITCLQAMNHSWPSATPEYEKKGCTGGQIMGALEQVSRSALWVASAPAMNLVRPAWSAPLN